MKLPTMVSALVGILSTVLVGSDLQEGGSCTLTGTCLTSDGKPVPDLDLVLSSVHSEGVLQERVEEAKGSFHKQRFVGKEVQRTKTDGKGDYVFAKIPPGTYQLSASPYYPDPKSKAFHEDLGEPIVKIQRDRTLPLKGVKRGRWIEVTTRGFLEITQDLPVIKDARVELWDSVNGRCTEETRTDKKGKAGFYFHDDSDAEAAFRASKDEDGEGYITARPGKPWETTSVEIVLVRTFYGRVKLRASWESGDPLGAPVFFLSDLVTAVPADKEGKATLRVAAEVETLSGRRSAKSRYQVVLDGAGLVAEGPLSIKAGAENEEIAVKIGKRAPCDIAIRLSSENGAISPGVTSLLLGPMRIVLRAAGAGRSPLISPSATLGKDGNCRFYLTDDQRRDLRAWTAEVWTRGGVSTDRIPSFGLLVGTGTLKEDAGLMTCTLELKSFLAGSMQALHGKLSRDQFGVRVELLAGAFADEAKRAANPEDRKSFESLRSACDRLAEEYR